jgi:hypothetical protein
MSHLYDNGQLWKHVSMVGFAEHYILSDDEDIAKPFATFQRQKQSQPPEEPIFSGVVLNGWQDAEAGAVEQRIRALKQAGIDYVRLHFDFGSAGALGEAQLADNPLCHARFLWLAEVAQICQKHEIVPLALLQLPWRETGMGVSSEYFKQAVESFASALKNQMVDQKKMFFETRPPMALSAQEEKGLKGTARVSLGVETGQQMFEVFNQAFDRDAISGFCVAGGSTKGDLPLAMEDDTQNAVRQGFRQCAQRQWGYEACFWEMGAKLMLQPKVGRLWGHSQAERDAARELFRVNAEDMAEEIMAPIHNT